MRNCAGPAGSLIRFGVLIVASNRARQLGGSVALVSPPEMVRKILAGTQLQQAFSVYESIEDAVAAFSDA